MNAFDQCYRIMNLDSYEIARNGVFASFKQNTLWWKLIMVESKIKRKNKKYNNNKVQEKLTMTLADERMYFVYNNNNVMCTIEESKMKHKNWQIAKSIIFFYVKHYKISCRTRVVFHYICIHISQWVFLFLICWLWLVFLTNIQTI